MMVADDALLLLKIAMLVQLLLAMMMLPDNAGTDDSDAGDEDP